MQGDGRAPTREPLHQLFRHYRYRDNQREHVWQDEGSVDTLVGKTVLVMGTGDIGTAFAHLVHAMGATVWGVRRRVGECHEPFARMIALSDVHAHLGSVDVVASVLPSTDQTRGLANKDFFAAMKPGSYFVNAGRGDLVVSEDLYEALRSNHLAGAALDVTNPEPLPADHMLWQEPNALITPHVAGFWHLQATTDNVVAICKENLIRYIAGEPLRNLVAR
ncbi:MAG: D-2-hydroxyacid dehydrogenase [Atopobiaceae bacterium]|nr:D-2-hydroxyacid dehydrogenase [Atopobiaceae bacterium]